MNENDWHNAINHAEHKGELKGRALVLKPT